MKQIVLDTETTGLSVKDGHRVIEIGCIELDNLVPTKNAPFSGVLPQTMAGAPSHFVVILILDVGSDNIFPNSRKNLMALKPPIFPLLTISSSKCSKWVFLAISFNQRIES